MIGPLTLGLIQNAAILLSIAVLYDLATWRRPLGGRGLRELGVGVVLGAVAVGLMVFSIELASGLIFDTRSVLLAVSGLFFGVIPTAIAAVVAAAYRLAVGGAGAWTGVLVIASSAALGVLWRRRTAGRLARTRFGELYLLGWGVHLTLLALMLTLPDGRASFVISRITLPVLVINPLATAALGLVLVQRLRRDEAACRLAESEARYRSFFEENHAVMLLIDPESGGIVDANPAAAAFYGYPCDVLRSMSLWDLNTLSEEEVRAELARASSAPRRHVRFRHRRADGSIRDIEAYSGPIPVEGKTLIHAIVHDVTEQERVREELREQERALRLHNSALEATATPIVITDREGTIEWVNPAFTELTGHTREEAVGRNPRDLVNSGVHDPGFFDAMWKTILGGAIWRGELTNRRKDGTLYRELQTITPVLNENGAITHFVAVKSDLSPRLEMEERLARAQQLETVGRLAGGIAHDFNNLLTVINGTVELALTEIDGDHPLGRDLDEIREAGERGSRLTRQLLAFSRRQVLEAVALDLNELVDAVLRMLGRLLGEHIAVEVHPSETPPWIKIDRSQIEQVISNLALNARDAMPRGGTLTFETRIVELEAGDERLRSRRAPGRYVSLRVRDTGTGMSEEVLEQVFEPFFTTKPAGEGTGLGLPTVYGIVTQSGGEVEVRSVEGEGTTFEIIFPLSRAPEAAEVTSTGEDDAPHTDASILLVEDEPSILRVAVRVLKRAGYTVTAVGSGAEAIELARTNGGRFDLVFTDVVMPGMSGPEVVEALREINPDIRVLFASGYIEDVLRSLGVASENGHFIAKPYTIESLEVAVAGVLRDRVGPAAP